MCRLCHFMFKTLSRSGKTTQTVFVDSSIPKPKRSANGRQRRLTRTFVSHPKHAREGAKILKECPKITHRISANRICHGRYPCKLSTRPNFRMSDGSGKPFWSVRREQNTNVLMNAITVNVAKQYQYFYCDCSDDATCDDDCFSTLQQHAGST